MLHPALFRFSSKEIAEICQVSPATARRWKRGAFCPPASAIMILERDLGCFARAREWRSWRIEGGDLIGPDGWRVDRNAALAVPLLHQQIAALRTELRLARAEIERLRVPLGGATATAGMARSDEMSGLKCDSHGRVPSVRRCK